MWSKITMVLVLIILVSVSFKVNGQKTHEETIKCGTKMCQSISGIFTKNPLISGYTHVTTIPKGAIKITITEIKSSPNLLVLRSADGHYITNGNFSVSPSGLIEAAGSEFDYRRLDSLLLVNSTNISDHNSDSVTEWITCNGPIDEAVQLLILAKHHNPGVKFEYNLPINSTVIQNSDEDYSSNEDAIIGLKSADVVAKRPGRRRFLWKVVGFSPCSKTCGGGMQTPIIKCIRENPARVFNPKRCAHLKQPSVSNDNMMKCNTQPCPAYWKVSDWTDCRCLMLNEDEFKSREVKCVQELMSGIVIQVNQGACIEEEPLARDKCNCKVNKNRKKPESILNRPINSRSKIRKKVETEVKRHGTWLSTPWSEQCTAVCGVGLLHRSIFCDRSNSLSSERCDLRTTPDISKECTSNENCAYGEWFVGPWSRCSGDCFNLTKGRAIVCIKNDAFADDNECNGDEKPLTLEKCRMDEIDYCRPKWHYSDWSECSKKCGGGTQRRVVKCVEPIENDGIMKESQNCRFAEREAIYRTCNEEKCEENINTAEDVRVDMVQSDAACVDDFPNCHLVVKAKLCSYAYYSNRCCESCKIRTNKIF